MTKLKRNFKPHYGKGPQLGQVNEGFKILEEFPILFRNAS